MFVVYYQMFMVGALAKNYRIFYEILSFFLTCKHK
jgi:hypothetical protein